MSDLCPKQAESFAKVPDADAVQDVQRKNLQATRQQAADSTARRSNAVAVVSFFAIAARRTQTYHADRQVSEQRTTQKCAAEGIFAKVSGYLKVFSGSLLSALCPWGSRVRLAVVLLLPVFTSLAGYLKEAH